MMDQIERITAMEAMLTETRAAIESLETALDRYEAARAMLARLGDYYGSRTWRRDLADDEAGLLPPELRRGVLSEDGIYNVLEADRELRERLSEMAGPRPSGTSDAD